MVLNAQTFPLLRVCLILTAISIQYLDDNIKYMYS